MDDQVRQVIADHARLPVDVASLGEDEDLYRAGMSSHATVNVMIGLEDEFNVEFEDSMLGRKTFQSIASIRAALKELGARPS